MNINTNIDVANTEAKINDTSEVLSLNENNDKEDNEIFSVGNIKINENVFKEK